MQAKPTMLEIAMMVVVLAEVAVVGRRPPSASTVSLLRAWCAPIARLLLLTMLPLLSALWRPLLCCRPRFSPAPPALSASAQSARLFTDRVRTVHARGLQLARRRCCPPPPHDISSFAMTAPNCAPAPTRIQ